MQLGVEGVQPRSPSELLTKSDLHRRLGVESWCARNPNPPSKRTTIDRAARANDPSFYADGDGSVQTRETSANHREGLARAQ